MGMATLLCSSRARDEYGAKITDVLADAVSLVVPGEAGTTDADVAWFSTDLFYSTERAGFLAALERDVALRWLQSVAAGNDLPFYPSLVDRGVVITASHANAISIAEYVMGAVLRAYQRPQEWEAAQSAHEWSHHEFDEVWNTTWFIFGFGAIGGAVGERARGFGARIVGIRRTQVSTSRCDELLAPPEAIPRLGEADVVVLARPGDPDGESLVDDEFLALMKKGSILVNVGRGSLVDVPALLRGLDDHRPRLAVLDVFDPEPLEPTSPLWSHDRVVITPHSSSGGLGRYQRNADLLIENLQRYLRGDELLHRVDPTSIPSKSATLDRFK